MTHTASEKANLILWYKSANSFQNPAESQNRGVWLGRFMATDPSMCTCMQSRMSSDNYSLPPKENRETGRKKICLPNNPTCLARKKMFWRFNMKKALKYVNHSTHKWLIIYNNGYLLIIWVLWTAACCEAYWHSSLRTPDVFILGFDSIFSLGKSSHLTEGWKTGFSDSCLTLTSRLGRCFSISGPRVDK